MSSVPNETAGLTPPKWLSKAEKFAFHRLITQREAVGKPILATETDAFADLVAARGRLTDLHRLYRSALRELKKHPTWPDSRSYVLRLAGQIDAATARCQRMERNLGLGPAN
jgi:hypothetical protein